MTNDTNSETLMTHVPMCHACGSAEVAAPFTTADGMGFCSAACEAEAQAEFAAWSDEQDADEPFGPMSERFAEYDEERKLEGDMDGEPAGSYDLSDDAEALASAGFGTDEDYGYYGDDF